MSDDYNECENGCGIQIHENMKKSHVEDICPNFIKPTDRKTVFAINSLDALYKKRGTKRNDFHGTDRNTMRGESCIFKCFDSKWKMELYFMVPKNCMG